MRTFPSRWHSSAACKEAAKSKRKSSKTTSNFKAMPLSHLKTLGAVVDSHGTPPPEEEINQNDPSAKIFSLKISRSLWMALYLARSARPWALGRCSPAGQAGGEITVRQQASVEIYPFSPTDGHEVIEWKLMESSAEDGVLGRGTTVNSTAIKCLIPFNSIAEKEQPVVQDLSATQIESGVKDSCGEISDDELNEEEASIFFRRKAMNARRLRGDFPPPLASLSRKAVNSQEGCVLLQPIRSQGRFMLREVKVAPRLPFLSIRTNGRLVLQLIHPQELATESCSNDVHTSSATAVSETVDHIRLDEVKPASVQCNTKAEQANYGNDKSLLNWEETGEKGHRKNTPLDEALEFSSEAAKKLSGSEASLLHQQTPRQRHFLLGANRVVDPTDGPAAEGSISAKQIISGEDLLNQEGNKNTRLPRANRIIHHCDEQAEDLGEEWESTFMAHGTRGKIHSSRSRRNVAGSELKDDGSISCLLISNKNECASDNLLLNIRKSCSFAIASRNEAKTLDRGVSEGLQQGSAANHPFHKLSTPNKMLTFNRRPQECAVATS